MANGDPLLIGLTQPPNNRADSGTLLLQNGSPFGTQIVAFWVQRLGSPICSATIRGDNFSTPNTPGVFPAGVLGMVTPQSAGIGVLGATSTGPNLFFGDTGVMGVANSFGVVGRSLVGLILDEPGSFLSGTGVVGRCDDGVGVHGTATSGWGIIGESQGRAGVTGRSVNGAGVEARSDQSHGVQATSQGGVGVLGESTGNDGVLGRSRDAVGVDGFSQQGLAGVRGRSNMYGVIGESEQGVGVLGMSPTNAIQGRSTGTGGASIGVSGWSAGGAGVQGDSDTGIGIGGRSPRGWAGYFEGNVIVQGALYVNGPKSAAVRHPDGSHRSLFCLESPESYFEDFGEVELAGETVVVKLEEDFAALVKRNKYQVFLTSYGPEALYVRRREAGEFEIARIDRGKRKKLRKVRVGYRIVARRADLKSARLPKIEIPANEARAKEPVLAAGNAKRKRTARTEPQANFEPLPRTPELPAPDLQALSEASPAPDTDEG